MSGCDGLGRRGLLADSVSCLRRKTAENVRSYLICGLCEQRNLTRLGKFHVVISNIPVLDLGSEKALCLVLRVEGALYPYQRIRSCRLA